MLDNRRKFWLPEVTLCAVDTTDKVALTERAIEKCTEQCHFPAVKLFTNDASRKHAVPIPALNGLEGYSQFITRELHKHVATSHVLIVQHDGYIVNPLAWKQDWLRYDYIGAPWEKWKVVGNGGFSLRSKKLLEATAKIAPGELPHPEDSWICYRHRNDLCNLFGLKFAPYEIASRFAFEGRSYDGKEWKGLPTQWANQFGFHSWLTVLPDLMDRPLIFHHSGDAGDVIYSLPVIKSLGGGVLFLSTDNRHPWPKNTRWAQGGGDPSWAGSLATLLDRQPYIWRTLYTHARPFSADVDLNLFREFYRTPRPENMQNLFTLHCKAFGVSYPEDEPWLQVDEIRKVPGRDIVVNRTERFHNPDFPWAKLVLEHGKRMVFVGTTQEHRDFLRFGQVPRHPTDNLLQVAQIIAGARLFIGNQSCPLAIAHGLCQKVIVEEWPKNPNCHLNRPGTIYWTRGHLEIPRDWL